MATEPLSAEADLAATGEIGRVAYRDRPWRRRSRALAQAIIGGAALMLFVMAARMNGDWIDRHILPDLLVPTGWVVALIEVERVALVLIAAWLILRVRPAVDRAMVEGRIAAVARFWIGLAALTLLAIPASEAVLRVFIKPGSKAWFPKSEPLREPDPLIGWRNIPARVGIDRGMSPPVIYVLDRNGYRVALAGEETDLNAPSVLFLGESVMAGQSLNWRDSIPGQVRKMTGIATANLAVGSFSVSQAYLHLRRELPRFRHPLAVVIIFTPTLMSRELDLARPRIDLAGQRHEPIRLLRLNHLFRMVFPYFSPAAIREAALTDRKLLQADAALARARGAQPIVLVPVFMPESPLERRLRAEVLDGTHIPYLLVPLDPRWRLPRDHHPDARADRVMASAITQWLKRQGVEAPASAPVPAPTPP